MNLVQQIDNQKSYFIGTRSKFTEMKVIDFDAFLHRYLYCLLLMTIDGDFLSRTKSILNRMSFNIMQGANIHRKMIK